MSVFRAIYLVTKAKPAAQLLRRMIDWARPATAGEWTFDFSELFVLPKDKQGHRTFRKRQFEIAGV